MKISHYDLSSPIEFKNNSLLFIVEGEMKFYEYCNDIVLQQQGNDGRFIFINEQGEINLKKQSEIIFDYFSLSLQDKKIITGLYNNLTETIENSFQEKFYNIKSVLVNFLEDLNIDSSYPLTYNEDFVASDLLKNLKVSPLEDYNSLLEKIVSYIDLISEFTTVKLLVFVNLRNFLTQEDSKTLLEHIKYSSINTLFIEKNQPLRVLNEKMLIIDKDLCEILVDD